MPRPAARSRRSGPPPAAGHRRRWPGCSARSPGNATGRCHRSGRPASAADASRAPGRTGSWEPRRRPRSPRSRPTAAPARRGRRTASTDRPARSSRLSRRGRRTRPRRVLAWHAARWHPGLGSARPSPGPRRSAGRTPWYRCPRRSSWGRSPAGTAAPWRPLTRRRGAAWGRPARPATRGGSFARRAAARGRPSSQPKRLQSGARRAVLAGAATATAGRTAPRRRGTTGGRVAEAPRTWRSRTGPWR